MPAERYIVIETSIGRLYARTDHGVWWTRDPNRQWSRCDTELAKSVEQVLLRVESGDTRSTDDIFTLLGYITREEVPA